MDYPARQRPASDWRSQARKERTSASRLPRRTGRQLGRDGQGLGAVRGNQRVGALWLLAAIVGSTLGGLTLTVLTGGIPLTWLTASQYDKYAPASSGPALLADTALWTLTALCGCLAVRTLVSSLSGRRADRTHRDRSDK
ncbi:MAG: hypothetical protein JWM19_7244 [Actinomycetia bacterium]|nr:hypothetical protein [Actinomycetes bacterium]